MVTIADTSLLITGASGGIGRALVAEALNRGARRVYAGTIEPFAHPDSRVVAVPLDVTDERQAARAAEAVASLDPSGSLDILVNNAGIALYDDLSDPSVLEQHLAVNLFGTHRVTLAFLPLLTRSGGTVVNNLSINALAPLPVIPSYSVSKAAAFSLTQSLRALLAPRGIRVHAVLTGPVDTPLTAGIDLPKAAPDAVARAIFDGLEKDEDEIFPDAISATVAEPWPAGPFKQMEHANVAMVADALAAAAAAQAS
jgi:NAD(P)-dependent dehydrogenase (short-subunit alcohol dehydrogenase family)